MGSCVACLKQRQLCPKTCLFSSMGCTCDSGRTTKRRPCPACALPSGSLRSRLTAGDSCSGMSNANKERGRRVLGLDPPAGPQNASSLRTTVAPVLDRRPCRGDHAARGVARECYLVDPASSHMLVSKIKPCMCKYELLQTVKLRMAH